MGFNLQFEEPAVRSLDRIDPKIRGRLIAKLTWYSLQPDPLKFASALKNHKLGTHRFRVGDWRVIVDLTDDTTIRVLGVGHHREIYR